MQVDVETQMPYLRYSPVAAEPEQWPLTVARAVRGNKGRRVYEGSILTAMAVVCIQCCVLGAWKVESL